MREDYLPVLSFNFTINEDGIVKLLQENKATYSVEIYCPTTFVRRIFRTNKISDEFVFNKGDLYRKVEVSAFVVCTEPVKNYFSPNFNKEFDESKFDLHPGDVLAATDTEVYYWDTELMAPLSSVFNLVANDQVAKGMFEIDTSADKVNIQMHTEDKSRFEKMRDSNELKSFALFTYFPVVAEVLRQMKDGESDSSKDKKWYRAIHYKIDELGKNLESAEPFVLAQELLKKPLKYILPPI